MDIVTRYTDSTGECRRLEELAMAIGTVRTEKIRHTLLGLFSHELEFQEERARLRALEDAFDGYVYICSAEMRIEYANAGLRAELGRDPAGEECFRALHRRDAPCPWCVHDRVLRGETVRYEVRSPATERWYSVSNAPLRHTDGTMAKLALIQDITDRKHIEGELRASEQRYRVVAENTHDCESWHGPEGHLLYISPSCRRITGYEPEEFFRRPGLLEEIVHKHDLLALRQFLCGCDTEDMAPEDPRDFRLFRKDGRMCWVTMSCRLVSDEQDGFLGRRCSMRDITDRKIREMELRNQALHDHLTGLPNRVLCLDRIANAMERSKRRSNYFYAVVLVDLDRFKVVNESLGHVLADKFLVEFSTRLLHHVRRLDTVARLGGDEFAIILDELAYPGEAIRILKRVRESLRRSVEVEGYEAHLTASFGIVVSPTHYSEPEELLQNAAIAMRRAKECGQNRFKVFNSKMLEQAVSRMALENDLRRALLHNEFEVHFQPIMALPDNGEAPALEGFEALVRWRHPRQGLLPPAEFIHIAEDTGLIVELGQVVLRTACRTMARWRETTPGIGHVTLSVNLSPRQFGQPDLVESVLEILEETGLPSELLRLELTESLLMDTSGATMSMMRRLKHLGLRISVDDFGTGYSSLSYLEQLPIDSLKVDRSFIQRLGTRPGSAEIVRAVVAMAHSLGLHVVAEGVEQKSQLDLLRQLKCQSVQGFYYSKPLTAEETGKLLLQANSATALPA